MSKEHNPLTSKEKDKSNDFRMFNKVEVAEIKESKAYRLGLIGLGVIFSEKKSTESIRKVLLFCKVFDQTCKEMGGGKSRKI